VVLAVVVLIIGVASVLMQPRYPQATGIVPQVVSCVPESKPKDSGPDWKPTLIALLGLCRGVFSGLPTRYV